MSKQVDERVVSMEFDNSRFERNVATSMSTLDKLKQSLKFTGASKGLENINSAAKNVNMNGLGTAVESVTAKFSALQVMGTTALVRITNQAITAGERMVKALTIDPVKTGFQEYETQIGAIQTILANTQKEGTNVEIVNKALDELNTYADKTIYNFTEMTRNIGTFTAAGIKLDTSVNAIKGIANLAAVSGSTSQQASTAMYQLSQALAAGKVQLMDWNSVVNAGMGGQVFQDALIRTSELLKTGAKDAIATAGSFRESLTKSGWLTTEVLTETLKQLSGAYTEADLLAQGYTKDQAQEIMKLAKTAEEAATKVKTWTQLWDTLKEAAQSGWSQTWRLIIGDFEEAKELFTGLSDFIGGFIERSSNARNKLLESALGKGFMGLVDNISSIIEPAAKAMDALDNVTSAIENLDEIVEKVINGNFGNGEARVKALTEAGYDWATVQNKVNEKLGSSVRHASKLTEAQSELAKSTDDATKSTSEEKKETTKLTDEQKSRLKVLAHLSDEQLRAKGYTDEQIEAFKELRTTAEKLGLPLNDFIDNLDKINGRWLLLNSFKNIGLSIVRVFSSIGNAFKQIFEPIKPEQLFDAIAAFHKFSTVLLINEETANNITRTFKGLFAILDIIGTIAGGGVRLAFKVLQTVLGAFNMDILDLTANLGDALVAFRDWLFEENLIARGFDYLISKLPAIVDKIKELGNAFLNLPIIQEIIAKIVGAFEDLKNIDLDEVGRNILEGLRNGLDGGVGSIIDFVMDIGNRIIEAIKEVLDINSPSKVMITIGAMVIAGLIIGLQNGVDGLWNVIQGIGEWIITQFKNIFSLITDKSGNIEWNKIFAGGAIVAITYFVKKISDSIGGISKAFEGFGELMSGAGSAIKSFDSVLKGLSWDLKAKAIQKMAISLAILVASIWLLAQIDDVGALWNAVAVVGALAAILVGLAIAVDKMSQSAIAIDGKKVNIDGLKQNLISIGAAILLLGITVKLIGSMNPEEAKQGFIGLTAMVLEMVLFMGAMSLLNKNGTLNEADKIGKAIRKMATAMLMMVLVVKLISFLKPEEITKGVIAMEAFVMLFAQMGIAARIAGSNADAGKSIKKMATAMLIMVAVVKLASMLDPYEIGVGLLAMEGFVLLFTQMGLANRIAGQNNKAGKSFRSMAVAMAVMVGVVKLISMISQDDINNGLKVMEVFVLMFLEMAVINRVAGQNNKIGGTLLAMSLSMAILAGIAIILSTININDLAKGIIAVGMLSLMMTTMIKALKGAQNVKGAIMMMAISIGVMAASLIALSFVEPEKLIPASAALGLLMAMFSQIAKNSKNLKKALPSLIVMTVIVGVLAGILAGLSLLNVKDTLNVALSLSALLLAMTLAMKPLSKIGNDAKSAIKGALALTAMVIPMMAFVQVLKEMNGVEVYTKTLVQLVSLAGVCTLLMYALKPLGKNMDQVAGGILALTAMTIPMLTLLDVLKEMNGVEASTNTIVQLVALTTACTLLLYPLKTIGKDVFGAVAGALALTSMMLPMLAFVQVLNQLSGIETANANVNALIKLATACTLMLVPLTLIGTLAFGGALLGVTALTTMAIPLVAFVGVLALMSMVPNAISVAEALTNLMSVMGNMLIQLSLVAPLAVVAVAAIAGLEMVITAFGVLAVAIGALMEKFPGLQSFLDTGISVLEQLAYGIGSLVGNLVTGFSDAVLSQLPTYGTYLSSFILNAMPFIVGIKMVDSSVLEGVGYLAGAVLALVAADLISGIASIISFGSSFADLGTTLSQFAINLMPFLNIMRTLDPSAIEGVNSLTSVILKLTASDLISRITSGIFGEASFDEFGSKLVSFGNALVQFSDTVKGKIDETAVQAAANAGTLMTELQSKIVPTGGVVQWFTGEKDIAEFGRQLVCFGVAIKSFSDTVAGGIDEAAVQAAANAGTLMSELQSKVVPTGGVIQWFTGEKDMGEFGRQLSQFGFWIKNFSKTVSEDGSINEEAITAAKNAGMIMTELQGAIEPTGGVLEFFTGTNDLSTFGSQISAYGKAIVEFSDAISGKIDEESVTAAANAGKIMADLQKNIPENKWLDGKADLSDFGSDIVDFGEDIADYANEVSGIDADSVSVSLSAARQILSILKSVSETEFKNIDDFDPEAIGESIADYSDAVSDIDTTKVSSSITSAKRLISLITLLSGLDTSGISNFKVAGIGTSMKKYADSVSDISTSSVSSSITSAKSLVTLINSLANLNTSGVSSFKSAIEELGTVQVGNIVKAFEGASGKMATIGRNLINSIANGIRSTSTSIITACGAIISNIQKSISSKAPMMQMSGVTLMHRFATGINSQRTTVSLATVSTLSSAVTAARGYYSSFYYAGSYLVAGFANGISANAYKAAAQARAMANAAKNAAEKALGIASPSKVFYKIGDYTGMGFVNSLIKYVDKVKRIANDIADSAIEGMYTSVDGISSLFNGELDAQPVIRPVLDLSEVQYGASEINSLFNKRLMVGAMANMSAINATMNANQNGDGEVVSAINKLRKELGNVGNSTYNINGVSYNDNSDVEEAIQTIVRAARIERRS